MKNINRILPTNYTPLTQSSTTVQYTPTDHSRALATIEKYNIFTDLECRDIIQRILYECDFETLIALRIAAKSIHFLATQCCEGNLLSPLALRVMISISLIEFVNTRNTDKFIFAKECTSVHIDRLNVIECLKYIDSHKQRNEPLENLGILAQELQALAKANKLILDWHCFSQIQEDDLAKLNQFISINDLSNQEGLISKTSIEPSHFHKLLQLPPYPKSDKVITSLLWQDLLNPENNRNELMTLNSRLSTNNFSDEQAFVLKNIEKLSLFISHNNFAQIQRLLSIISENNTPLPKLKTLIFTIDENCFFTLTEKNCPCSVTTLYVNAKNGVSLKLSQLTQLRKFHITNILEKTTVTLENLSSLIEISINRLCVEANEGTEDIIHGSLILKNLPRLTSFISNAIKTSAKLSFENVPNLKTLKVNTLPQENILKKYFLNITTLELHFFNEKLDLNSLKTLPKLNQLIIIKVCENESENENPNWLSINRLTALETLQIGDFSEDDSINTECNIGMLKNLTKLDLTNIGQKAKLNLGYGLAKLKMLRFGNIYHNNIFGSKLLGGQSSLKLPELEILSFGNINTQSKHLEFLSKTCLPKLKKLSFGDINAMTILPKNLSETIEEISFDYINARLTLPRLLSNIKYTDKSRINNDLIQYHPSDMSQNQK